MPINIQRLSLDQIPAAMQLVSLAGWNQTPSDWQRVIEYQTDGCFCAMDADELVGTVTSTSYGDDLAWIGMMLVHPDRRRQGIGMQLMQRVVEYLRSRMVKVIGLDATPAGRPLYEQLGFQAAFDFQRWQRSAVDNPAQPHAASAVDPQELVPLELDAFWERCSIDVEAFGCDRRQWLRRVARDSRVVHCNSDGFAMLRAGRIADYLGPIVSSRPDAAVESIKALVAASDRSIIWDMLQPSPAVLDIANDLGFQPVRALTRMFLDGVRLPVALEFQYAICDPASG